MFDETLNPDSERRHHYYYYPLLFLSRPHPILFWEHQMKLSIMKSNSLDTTPK